MKKKKARPTADDLADSEMFAYVTDRWSRTAVQPVLIALVTTAFMTAVAIAIDAVAGTSRVRLLAPFFLFAALEGVYTTLWLDHPQRRQLNRTAYRAAEFLFLALLLRAYTWAFGSNLPHPALLADYLRAPYLLVADGLFVLGLLLTLLAWARAAAAAASFGELAIDRAEAYYFTLPGSERQPGLKPAYSNRGALVANLFGHWIAGGVIIAIVTSVVALDPRRYSVQESLLALRRLDLPPALLMSLLIYFIGGFLLLSQARLAALNARWLHQGVIKAPAVERSWHRTTTWTLLAIALIALFLPLGSTFAIGRVLETGVTAILGLVTLLSYLFAAFLSLFFAPITNQLAEGTPDSLPTPPAATPQPTPVPPPPSAADETAQLVFSSAFWAVAIVVSIIAISFFLRDRGLRLDTRLWRQFGASLLAWFRSVWHDVADYAEDFRQGVRLRRQGQSSVATEEKSEPPWRFLRLNALSPREQIRYFYLSTVKRAGGRGVARAEGETPLEYAADLKQNWPDAEAEIDDLTDAFLRARYSREELEKADVQPVKSQWKQVKSRLRHRGSKPDGPNVNSS